MKYNLRNIMLRAWISEKEEEENAKRINEVKASAGVSGETNTWSGWKQLGYEVIHGSKALFGADLIWGSKGDGSIYKAAMNHKVSILVE